MCKICNSLANLPDQQKSPNRRDQQKSPNRRDLPTEPNEQNQENGEDGSNGSNGPNGPNGENKTIQLKANGKAKSTITKAHPKSPSVRTTIPRRIIEMLGWDTGDVLSWEIEKRGDKYFVKVRRLE